MYGQKNAPLKAQWLRLSWLGAYDYVYIMIAILHATTSCCKNAGLLATGIALATLFC